ncbi:C-X-C motif chemokine 9 [Dicentrarchus labrax]|uniref:C-X-C motif chemokine 9 n=1 Tax=Dicentrarchus labrax TaxID=13489 RepID=UPI0021F5B71A|nr:C-X-C motif chemokine 9 [Dicentrarchus labrax]
MKTVIQCLVLLACASLYTSQIIADCQCVKTIKGVNFSLIADVKEYGIRPYCNKKEVVVILKDQSSRCLDPKQKSTKVLLRRMQARKATTAKMNTTRPQTMSTTMATLFSGLK